MILSNITFSVLLSHILLFEQSLKVDCLAMLHANPNIQKVKTFKLLTEIDKDSQSISLQLFFESMDHFESFKANKQQAVFDLLDENFSQKYVYFQSLLEEI